MASSLFRGSHLEGRQARSSRRPQLVVNVKAAPALRPPAVSQANFSIAPLDGPYLRNASPNCWSITRPRIAKAGSSNRSRGSRAKNARGCLCRGSFAPLRAKSTVALPLSSPGHFSRRLKLEALCPLADHSCSASYTSPAVHDPPAPDFSNLASEGRRLISLRGGNRGPALVWRCRAGIMDLRATGSGLMRACRDGRWDAAG